MVFKNSPDSLTARLNLRSTPEDKAAIEAQAKLANLSVSEFMIRAALKHPISVKTDMHNVHEIRFFIEALRDIYNDRQPPNDERLRPVLKAAAEALNRIAARSHQVK